MEIYISGSLAYDRIMDFPGKFQDHILPEKIHIINVSFTVNGMKEKFGGTAGNIAYNLALLNEKPLIVASAGKDFEGYENWLRKHQLSLSGIRKIAEEFTACAYITTDEADNQITGFNPGAMKFPSLYDFNGSSPDTTIAIISPGCIEDMRTYSSIFKQRKIPYIFDPGQSIPALDSTDIMEMINGAQMLISNDYELEMIKKSTGWTKEDILQKTAVIVTTLGEHGSVITTDGNEIYIPAAKADRLHEPTGAGDAYRAGLIKGLVMKKSLPESAQMGSTCASYAVEKHGTQEHHFSMDEFWKRYRKNFSR
ncbi:MAG: carbohydrate kinase family protein [Desulfobacterales bacterium]